jgi:glucan phosphoethanolaminetransferase (alkaline phosphatase superfamily)
MKKNILNFWINIVIFIDFILVVFTGIVLREFPVDLSGCTVLGVPRKELADLHWVLSVSMILFIFAHLVLHWGWAKVSFRKHLFLGPKALAITAIVLVLVSMLVAPVYLTKDLPNRKAMRVKYSMTEPLPEIAASFGESSGNGASLKIN